MASVIPCGACRTPFVPANKASICEACISVMQRMEVLVRREPLARVTAQLQRAVSVAVPCE